MKRSSYDSGDTMLWVLGDTHVDHPNTDLKLINKHIAEIKDSGAPWLHLGDWVDAIVPTDRRYSINDSRESVVNAYLKVEEMFNPIIDQCVAVLRGNHGSKWSRLEGDMIKVLAKRWDVPYLGYCGLINFKLYKHPKHRRQTYKIWVHHGAGGGRKRGAKAIRLQDWSQFVEADLYLQAHTHTYQNFHDELLRFKDVKTRWFANTPGYIRSYRGHDNYIEELGLPPQPVGCLQVSFGSLKRDISIEAVIS